MMHFTSIEIVGYLASIVLMSSFIMKDIFKLRIINSIACILFVVYGFMLSTAWPIIISNGFIALVNLWHLTQKQKKH